MKLKVLLTIILGLTLAVVPSKVVHSEENNLVAGYATAYTAKPTAKTCTGELVQEGICGGYKPYIGKTIVLYQRLPDDSIGNLIGIYECKDTGPGTKSFQEGKVIDVFKSNKSDCQEFMNLIYQDNCKGHVWIQVIDKCEDK